MRRLCLHGALKKQFGAFFEMDVPTPTKALKLLDANTKGAFFRELRHGSYYVYSERKGVKVSLPLEVVTMRMAGDIHVVPEAAGSGGDPKTIGLLYLIVGVALIYSGVGAPQGTQMIAMGLGMALTGASLMLMRLPTESVIETQDVDERPSFAYNGPANSIKEGGPVPLIYGQVLAGSVLVSGSVVNINEPN